MNHQATDRIGQAERRNFLKDLPAEDVFTAGNPKQPQSEYEELVSRGPVARRGR